MKLSAVIATAALTLSAAAAQAHQPGQGEGHAHGHAQGHAQADCPADAGAHGAKAAEIKLGDLTLNGAFTRATLPGAPVAGGFVTITNGGTSDDRLIGGKASFAGEVQVHEMAMEGEVMKMRQLSDGLVIPAGSSVELKPGSYHLMFMGLKQPLTEGETVTIDVTFEKAGSVTLPLAVMSPGAKCADHTAH